MYQTMVVVIIIIFIVFNFIPLLYRSYYERTLEEVKHAINLSVKVLPNCIYESKDNQRNLAAGFGRSPVTPIEIDKVKLLEEFCTAMEMNMTSPENFAEVRECIVAKVIVYYDRFYIADLSNKWSPPYFFTVYKGGQLYYLYNKGDTVWYYDNGQIRYKSLSDVGISNEQRNEIVISKLNSIVEDYTYDLYSRSGIKIKIYNPDNTEPEYQVKNNYFNVLDGITFFVIFRDAEQAVVNNMIFNFDNAIVCGYTMD